MYKTIMLGSRVTVQGVFVKAMQNGKIAVRSGKQTFVGKPVSPLTEQKQQAAS